MYPDSFPPDWQSDKIPSSIRLGEKPISKADCLKKQIQNDEPEYQRAVKLLNNNLENGKRSFHTESITKNERVLGRIIATYQAEGWTVKRDKGGCQYKREEWDTVSFT